jgi:translocation and assembly module TamB
MSTTVMNATLKKWLKRAGIAFAILLVLIAAFAFWLLDTQSGARFAVERAKSALAGKLTLAETRGTLVSPLELHDVGYKDAAAGIDIKVKTLKLEYGFAGLLHRTLHVQSLVLDGVNVALTTVPQTAQPPQAATPSLQSLLTPPLDILLDKLHVGATRITQDGEPVFASNSLDVAAAWTHSGLVVRQFALRAPDGKADLTGMLDSYRDMRGKASLTFDWKLAPHRYAGVLDLDHDGKHGTLRGNVAIDDYTAQIDPLQFAFAGGRLDIETLKLHSPQIPGTLEAKATARLDAKPVSGTATLDWNDLELPADLAGQALATHGHLEAGGSADKFTAQGEVSVGPHDPEQGSQLADLALRLDGTPEKITLHELQLKQAHGGLDATGEIALKPRIGWTIDATANKLDPGAFAKDWPGAIDFALSTRGQMEKDGPAGTLKLEKLGGTLRQRVLAGGADLSFAAPASVDGTLRLKSGGSVIALQGKGGDRTDVVADIDIASLGDWLPQAGGSLRGKVTAQGAWPKLDARSHVDAAKLAFGNTHLDALGLDLDVRDVSAPSGHVALDAKNLAAGGYLFDTVKLDAHGNRAAHSLALDAAGPQLGAKLALDGALADNDDWKGALSALELSPKNAPAWTLQHPAALAAQGGGFSLGELCLGSESASVCASANEDKAGAAQAKFSIAHLPLAAIARLAAPDAPLKLTGEIDGDGDIALSSKGVPNGSARITSSAGSVAYPDSATQPVVAYNDFNLAATFGAQNSRIDLHADLNDDGRLDGQIALGVNNAGAMPLSGNIAATFNNLAFVDLVNTQTANTQGKVEAKLDLGGTTAAPVIAGNLALAGFGTEIPAAGLKLHDGRVTLQSADGRTFALDGEIGSGKGKLALNGEVGTTADAPIALKISGSDFLAADIPGAQVRISPDLALARTAGKFALTGSVTIPKAAIDVSKLPGGGATAASPDVVVTDAERNPAAASTPLDADITVKLGAGEKLDMDLRQGREVHLVGFGLNGYLSGQLAVQERPGRTATGRGQIVVNGTYKAYGQDLTIDTGRLLFAGTPLDNPGLDLRATRGFPDAQVTVGLQVRGTAQVPVLTVFSTPAMEQSDALSYLVTGKPLSQLKGGEGNAVSSAAAALGTAGGDLLAKSIGSKMGLDDVGVADNSAVGGAALTIGKYLSPRLYLSYGVGLFTPGQVVTLRYRLSRHLNTELQNGTLSSRAGINYQIEK